MGNPPPKGREKRKAKDQTGPVGYLVSFFWFVLGTTFGTILSLFWGAWFLAYLPGPSVSLTITGLRGATGNTIGCTFYTFTL
ncbi:MAG: hypothetical protein MN733_25055, partial [Nitrososphaera sp.]|nr:hypothetical protein [Nitrososphaera sp.]